MQQVPFKVHKTLESDGYFPQNCDYFNGGDPNAVNTCDNCGDGSGYVNYTTGCEQGYYDGNGNPTSGYYPANAPQEGAAPNEPMDIGYEPQFYPSGEYESFDNLGLDFNFNLVDDDYNIPGNGTGGTNCTMGNEHPGGNDDENKR